MYSLPSGSQTLSGANQYENFYASGGHKPLMMSDLLRAFCRIKYSRQGMVTNGQNHAASENWYNRWDNTKNNQPLFHRTTTGSSATGLQTNQRSTAS